MSESPRIPLAMDGFDGEEIEAIIESFKSGSFTMGEAVSEFESRFADFIGSKYAVMVNSGSSANLLALEVLVHQKGNRNEWREKYVAVPSVLWPTSIWPIVQLGLRALIIDTLPESLEMDFQQLFEAKKFHGDDLVGAIVIHPLGKSLNLDEIATLHDLGMFVIEDNAESLGAGRGDTFAGTVGDFGTFSFYFSHHMTTVEGGMVITDNYEFANQLLSARAHGWTRNRLDKKDIEREHSNINPNFLFVTSGFNFRPMEFQGVVGKIQLNKITKFILKRIDNAKRVATALDDRSLKLIGGSDSDNFFSFVDVDSGKLKPVPHSWMALPILNLDKSRHISSIQEELKANGVDSRPLLAGNFSQQPAGINPQIRIYGELRNSGELYRNSFMVGNHHAFSDEQIQHLCKVLNNL